MRRIMHILLREPVISGMLIVGILTLNLLPDLVKWKQTPPGHAYLPVHNCAIDYALYLSYEKQGLDGQSVLFDRFTTEPHPGKWVNPFYLALGRLWGVTGIRDPHVVYHASRIGLGILWALTILWFIRRMLSNKTERLIALFFSLYSSSVPIIPSNGNLLSVGTYTAWWSELDPTVRALFLPAHLTGHMLMVCVIGLLTTKQLTVRRLVATSIAGFFAGLFHTPSLLLPILLLPTWIVFTGQWKRLVPTTGALLLSCLSFFILSQQFHASPWTNYWEYERVSFAIPLWEYLLGLGPIVLLGAAGAAVAWKQPRLRALVIWAAIGIVAVGTIRSITTLPIPYFNKLLVSNIRFMQIAIIIPLSLLSAVFLRALGKRIRPVLFRCILIALLFLTVISYPASLFTQISNAYQGPLFQWPSTGWIQAIAYLESGNKKETVLSLPFAGQAIGGFVNRTAFVGRPYSTLDMERKTDEAWKFLSGAMSGCEAYVFLRNNHIGQVFWGYDEQTAKGDPLGYPFLSLEKDFGDTKIYRFNPEIRGCE